LFYDLDRGHPDTPEAEAEAKAKDLKTMAVRDKIYKVRLSSEEVEMLKSANVLNIAKFMRDSSLNVVNKRKDKQVYSKLDRDFILELSRIGGNINQIAKALNTDIAKGEPFQAVKVLHLLIAINENLEQLKDDKK
jgi:hypothetical protein